MPFKVVKDFTFGDETNDLHTTVIEATVWLELQLLSD